MLQTFKELNTQYNNYNRRASSSSQPPLAVNRVKVTFKDEPGEGSGVVRSFYTAIAEVSLISNWLWQFYCTLTWSGPEIVILFLFRVICLQVCNKSDKIVSLVFFYSLDL